MDAGCALICCQLVFLAVKAELGTRYPAGSTEKGITDRFQISVY
jgi:hypothetical protein